MEIESSSIVGQEPDPHESQSKPPWRVPTAEVRGMEIVQAAGPIGGDGVFACSS
jgi:hypothetical protein